jgi:hypothetical protein
MVDARRRGELSVDTDAPPASANVARINSERRSHDTSGQCLQPSPCSEGTAWIVELKQATDWSSRLQVICNEVDNLVDEPGVTGQNRN